MKPDKSPAHPIRQDRDTEEALVAASLVAPPEFLDEIEAIIPLSMSRAIFDPDLRAIFETAMSMHALGEPRELLTIEEEMKIRGTFKGIETRDAMLLLVSQSLPNAHNAAAYAKIVRKNFMLRELVKMGHDLMINAGMDYADETKLAAKVMAESSALLEEIALRKAAASEAGVRSASDMVSSYVSDCYEGRAKSEVRTGFARIDSSAVFLPGDVIILAARPGVGKTAIGMEWARNIAIDGVPVGFLSLEMGDKSMSSRMLQRASGVGSAQMRNRQLSDYDIDQIDKRIVPECLYIDTESGITIGQARAKASLMHRRYGIKILFIDYMQLIAVDSKAENQNVAVTKISAGIKNIARYLDIPVVALAQLNRDSTRNKRAPELHDLRDSGSIEQDASIVVALHWVKNRTDAAGNETPIREMELHLLKNREGIAGVVMEYDFDPRLMRWTER